MLNQGPEYREPTTMPDTLEITPRKVVVVYTHQPIHVHTCSPLAHVCQHRHTGQDRSKHNGPRKKHRTKQSVLSASAPSCPRPHHHAKVGLKVVAYRSDLWSRFHSRD